MNRDRLASSGEHIVVTGYPGFTARRMTEELLRTDADAELTLVVADSDADQARAYAAPLDRVHVVTGDVSSMDLGLSGAEFSALVGRVTTIHHLASEYHRNVDKATLESINVDGTRNIIEFANNAPQLRRLCHWSTTAVSGKRQGVVLEEDLDQGQGFHNVYEETKYQAELLVRRAMRTIPATIFRPGIIVGDSSTGEIDEFEGPYYFMVVLATTASNLHVPFPGRGTAPLHLVPVDYVVRAACRLSSDGDGAGKTYHLTDPNPFPARRVYELVADQFDTRLARGFVPTGLARTLLRAPGVERLTRAPRSFLESLDQQVFYNSRHTAAALAGTAISCPPFDTYVENLVRFVRDARSKQQ